MAGSHIDTVPNGGMFDGAVGVLAALEAARRIAEEKVPLTKALEIASFTDEEGNLVGDFLGSRAFMGLLDEKEVRSGRTSFGVLFSDVLKMSGFTADGILAAHKDRPALEAYVELHIEQGPVLEDEGVPDRRRREDRRQALPPLRLRRRIGPRRDDAARAAARRLPRAGRSRAQGDPARGHAVLRERADRRQGGPASRVVQRHPGPGRFHAGIPQRRRRKPWPRSRRTSSRWPRTSRRPAG